MENLPSEQNSEELNDGNNVNLVNKQNVQDNALNAFAKINKREKNAIEELKEIDKKKSKKLTDIWRYIGVSLIGNFVFLSAGVLFILLTLSLSNTVVPSIKTDFALMRMDTILSTYNSALLELRLASGMNENAELVKKSFEVVKESVDILDELMKTISSGVVMIDSPKLSNHYFKDSISNGNYNFIEAKDGVDLLFYEAMKATISAGYDTLSWNLSLFDTSSNLAFSRLWNNNYNFMKAAVESCHIWIVEILMDAYKSDIRTRTIFMLAFAFIIIVYYIISFLRIFRIKKSSTKVKMLFLQIHSSSLSGLIFRCEKFINYKDSMKYENEDLEENEFLEEQSGIASSIHQGDEGSSIASSINRGNVSIKALKPTVMVQGLKRRRKFTENCVNKLNCCFLAMIIMKLIVLILIYFQLRSSQAMAISTLAQIMTYQNISMIPNVAFSQERLVGTLFENTEAALQRYSEDFNRTFSILEVQYSQFASIPINSDSNLGTIYKSIETILYGNESCSLIMKDTEWNSYSSIYSDACNSSFLSPLFNKVNPSINASLEFFIQSLILVRKSLV